MTHKTYTVDIRPESERNEPVEAYSFFYLSHYNRLCGPCDDYGDIKLIHSSLYCGSHEDFDRYLHWHMSRVLVESGVAVSLVDDEDIAFGADEYGDIYIDKKKLKLLDNYVD